MLDIAICEDDRIFAKRLSKKISSYCNVNNYAVEIDTFHDGEEILKTIAFNNKEYEVIFFDINLPKIDGIEAARLTRKIDKNFLLIFLTSLDEEVYRVFELDTFIFIRKSLFDEEIDSILDAIVHRLSDSRTKYDFKTIEGTIKLPLTEILYFRMINRRVHIKTLNSVYITTITVFNEIERQFSKKGFVSIYRGMIVNIDFIRRINKDSIELDNGEILQVSRYKISQVRNTFLKG